MRIAFFLYQFPTVSETFILRQITGLIDLGHEIDIYAETRSAGAEPLHPELHAYGLPGRTTYFSDRAPAASVLWDIPAWPPKGQTWVPGASAPLANRDRLLEAAPVLAECLRAEPRLTLELIDPDEYAEQAASLSALYRLHALLHVARDRGLYDVLHAHFGPTGNSVRFARRLLGAPLVVTFHGYDFSAHPRRHGLNVYQKLFAAADAVTVNSHHTSARVRELGCPAEKVHLLRVGIRPEEFPFSERTRRAGEPVRLLSVCRLVEKKGMEFALRAAARVRGLCPGVELHYDLVGDGPLRQPLERLARELGLEQTVHFHGARDVTAIRQFMASAHLFVLPSVTAADGDQEGQGLVLQEAQASGLPVVATDHGAFPEGVLVGRSGFLVPERDVEALAAQLKHLIDHSDQWPAVGRSGREYVESKYDIRRLNRDLVQLYEMLISSS